MTKKTLKLFGMIGLGVWILWFLIQNAPVIGLGNLLSNLRISLESLKFMTNILFILVCFGCILLGMKNGNGKETSKNKK